MTSKQEKEWNELTFSQREGKAPLPEALQLGKLTRKFKNNIWYVFESDMGKYTYCSIDDWNQSLEENYWSNLIFSYQFDVLEISHMEIAANLEYSEHWLENLIFKKEYHEILNLIEYMFNFKGVDQSLLYEIEQCMKLTPYLIDRSSEPVRIIPTTSEEMKETVKQSLENINKSELIGAKSHLHKAAQELNNENYSGAIRESIHAVESVVRKINPKKQNHFASALDLLENKKMIKHRALKEAFKKLYDYTSDEKGIRHPLIEEEAADVGFNEAIFMYAACVAFVDYLVSKQRQLEDGETG